MTDDQTTEWEASVAAVISVKPGDHLLVTLDGSANPQVVDEMSTRLRERFPDVEISVLAGAARVIHLDHERLETLERRVRDLEYDYDDRRMREHQRLERSGP